MFCNQLAQCGQVSTRPFAGQFAKNECYTLNASAFDWHIDVINLTCLTVFTYPRQGGHWD